MHFRGKRPLDEATFAGHGGRVRERAPRAGAAPSESSTRTSASSRTSPRSRSRRVGRRRAATRGRGGAPPLDRSWSDPGRRRLPRRPAGHRPTLGAEEARHANDGDATHDAVTVRLHRGAVHGRGDHRRRRRRSPDFASFAVRADGEHHVVDVSDDRARRRRRRRRRVLQLRARELRRAASGAAMLDGELLPRGRQVDFTRARQPERWKPGFATPFNQRDDRREGPHHATTSATGCCSRPTSSAILRRGTPAARRAALREAQERELHRRARSTLQAQAERWRRKKQYLFHGPTLHAIRADAPLQPRLPVLPQLDRRHGADRHRHVVRGGRARASTSPSRSTAWAHHDRVPGRRADRQLGRAAAHRRVRDAEERRRPGRCSPSRWSRTCR